MNRKTVKWFASLGFLIATAALAQTNEPTLKVGDPAPKLQTGEWVQGDPVKQLEKGKAYIVEFWATWCGPCRVSIPHLNKIYNKYKDRGLVVIGQDSWEHDESLVAPFIKTMGDKMTYRVALDDKEGSKIGKMAETWMTAAGQDGIPAAFLVDAKGVIVWIGYPMGLKEKMIEDAIAGKVDVAKAVEEHRRDRKNEAQFQSVWKEVVEAIKAKDWDKATAKLAETEKLSVNRDLLDFTRFKILVGKQDHAGADKLAATMKQTHQDDPKLQDELDMARLKMLFLIKEYPEAYQLAARMSETRTNDADLQNDLAWQLITDKAIEQPNLALAETIATRANDGAKGKSAPILDTLARVLYMEGKKGKAIESQEKAVGLAEGPDKAYMQEQLDKYKNGE